MKRDVYCSYNEPSLEYHGHTIHVSVAGKSPRWRFPRLELEISLDGFSFAL